MYKKVLVALDGTPVVEAALSFLVPVAALLGFELVLLEVVPFITPAESEDTRRFGSATDDAGAGDRRRDPRGAA